MENYRQINFSDFPEKIDNIMLCVIDDTNSRYELLGKYNGYYPGTQQLDFTILYFRVKTDIDSNPWVSIFERYDGNPYEVENKFDRQLRYINRSLMKQGAIAQLRLNSEDMNSRYIIYGWIDLAKAEEISIFVAKYVSTDTYPVVRVTPLRALNLAKISQEKNTLTNPDAKDPSQFVSGSKGIGGKRRKYRRRTKRSRKSRKNKKAKMFYGGERIKYPNGNIYDGDIDENRVPYGEGTMIYPPHANSVNGDVYEGNWENGQRSGRGTMTYANGEVWVGIWQNGRKIGRGMKGGNQSKKVRIHRK